MTTDYTADRSTRLWGVMQHWLGWRMGREAARMDSGEAIDNSNTQRWHDALQRTGYSDPRALANTALAIIAEARGLSFRELARNLLEAASDPLAEVPEPERLILAIHYQTKEQRQEAVLS